MADTTTARQVSPFLTRFKELSAEAKKASDPQEKAKLNTKAKEYYSLFLADLADGVQDGKISSENFKRQYPIAKDATSLFDLVKDGNINNIETVMNEHPDTARELLPGIQQNAPGATLPPATPVEAATHAPTPLASGTPSQNAPETPAPVQTPPATSPAQTAPTDQERHTQPPEHRREREEESGGLFGFLKHIFSRILSFFGFDGFFGRQGYQDDRGYSRNEDNYGRQYYNGAPDPRRQSYNGRYSDQGRPDDGGYPGPVGNRPQTSGPLYTSDYNWGPSQDPLTAARLPVLKLGPADVANGALGAVPSAPTAPQAQAAPGASSTTTTPQTQAAAPDASTTNTSAQVATPPPAQAAHAPARPATRMMSQVQMENLLGQIDGNNDEGLAKIKVIHHIIANPNDTNNLALAQKYGLTVSG